MYNKSLINDYIVKETKDKILIKGQLVFSLIEKAGIYFFIFLTLLIFLSMLRFLNSGLTMAVSIIGTLIFIFFFKYRIDIFTIDKTTKNVHANYDKFDAPLSGFTNFEIQEITIKSDDQKIYRLIYHLKNGAVISKFAFTSYNKTQDLIGTLQKIVIS